MLSVIHVLSAGLQYCWAVQVWGEQGGSRGALCCCACVPLVGVALSCHRSCPEAQVPPDAVDHQVICLPWCCPCKLSVWELDVAA